MAHSSYVWYCYIRCTLRLTIMRYPTETAGFVHEVELVVFSVATQTIFHCLRHYQVSLLDQTSTGLFPHTQVLICVLYFNKR